MIQDAIERYARGAAVPLKALEGLTRGDLLAFPIPGTWSIQQIVLHLLDSDLVASDRMKRVIAEDVPLLVRINENQFVARLHYDELDVQLAAELFRLNRLHTTALLQKLPADSFNRVGIHTENGRQTLLEIVNIYAGHLDSHMAHLIRKRELLGKPLV
jgi:hypothetical protein